MFLSANRPSGVYLSILPFIPFYPHFMMVVFEGFGLYIFFSGKSWGNYFTHSVLANIVSDFLTIQFLFFFMIITNSKFRTMISSEFLKPIENSAVADFLWPSPVVFVIIFFISVLGYVPKNIYYYFIFYRKVKEKKISKAFFLNLLSFFVAIILPVLIILISSFSN